MEVQDLLKRAQDMLVDPSPPKFVTSSNQAAVDADDWVDINEAVDDTDSGWTTSTTSSQPGSPPSEPASPSPSPLGKSPSPIIAAPAKNEATDVLAVAEATEAAKGAAAPAAATAAAAPGSPPQLWECPLLAQAEKQKAVTVAAAAAGFSDTDLHDLKAMMKDMKGDIGRCTQAAEQALATHARTGPGGRGQFAWRMPQPPVVVCPPPVASAPEPPARRGPELDISDAQEVEVDFAQDQSAKDGFIITLKPKVGGRGVRLFVGEFEGSSLVRAVNSKLKTTHGRPMTYDFMKASLEGVGFKVAAVVVTSFVSNTYHALVHFEGGDGGGISAQVDSRPSDAINLALRSGAPVYVSNKVLAR